MVSKDARFGTPDRSSLHEAVLEQGSRLREKRRGSWNFLTWSFFLAQAIAAEKFFGSGARAADNDDTGTARSNDPSQTPSDDGAGAAAWGPGGQDAGDGRMLDPQASLNGAPGLLLSGVSQAASDYSAAGSAGAGDGGGIEGSGGGASSASDQPTSSQADGSHEDSSPIPPASEIPAGGPDDIIPPSPGIDLGVDIGPGIGTGLDLGLNLDPVAEAGLGLELGLGEGGDLGLELGLGLPLAGPLALDAAVGLEVNLLGDGAPLALGLDVSATSPLLSPPLEAVPSEFVTSVVSTTATGLEPLHQVGAVSSGDVIAFSGGAAPNLTDDLFTSGRYTDYGLTLHTDESPGLGSATNSLASNVADEGPTSLLDVSDADDQSRSSIGDNLDTSHFGVPSSIDELARNDTI